MDTENGKVRGSQNSLEFILWEVEETTANVKGNLSSRCSEIWLKPHNLMVV